MARYGGEDIVIDDSEFQRKAKKLATSFKVEAKEFIKEQGGLLARELAGLTPPWAGGQLPKQTKTGSPKIGTMNDIKAGRKAVEIGIRSICHSRKKSAINRAKRYFPGGPIFNGGQIANGAIDNEAELAAWHSRNKKPNGRTKRLPSNQKPWVWKQVLERYIKKEQKEVGIAKAAFVKASLQLGAKGPVLKAISDNLNNTKGSGKMSRITIGPQVVISGKADGLFHTRKFMGKARVDRLIKAKKRLLTVTRTAAKKAKFKTT